MSCSHEKKDASVAAERHKADLLQHVKDDREIAGFVSSQAEVICCDSINYLCLPAALIVNEIGEILCPYCTYGLIPESKTFRSLKLALDHVEKCRPVIDPEDQATVAQRNDVRVLEIVTERALRQHVKLMIFSKYESREASFIVGAIDALEKPTLPFSLYSLVNAKNEVIGFANYYIYNHSELRSAISPVDRTKFADAFSGTIPSAKAMQSYVLREYRRRGYGRFLAQETITHLCDKFHPLYVFLDDATDAGFGLWMSLPFPHSGKAIDVSEYTWHKNEIAALEAYCEALRSADSSEAFREAGRVLRKNLRDRLGRAT